jgi:hypothetical protein
MQKIKITLFQQKDNGETQILHTQWGEEIESKIKKELWNKIIHTIREYNMLITEEEDKLKELRKKRN